MTTWKDAALERAETITDAWEVAKAYAGRIAEWVLFVCMVVSIIEMLPGVVLWQPLINGVLGVQVVMLDVGGFALASMADYARQQGNKPEARRASITGACLIAIMIVTLLLVTIGILWPALKPYTDMAEKILILIRVIMTVIYGHVIHSLRSCTTQRRQRPQSQDELASQITTLQTELATLQERLQTELASQITTLQTELATAAQTLQESLQERLQSDLAREVATLHTDVQTSLQSQLASRQELAIPPYTTSSKEQRPRLHALPRVQPCKRTASPQDARSFIFASLQEQPDLKLADLAKIAVASGLQLSESSISRYRKQFFASGESSSVASQ